MDALFHGKPLWKWMIWGYCTPIFGNTHIGKNPRVFDILPSNRKVSFLIWSPLEKPNSEVGTRGFLPMVSSLHYDRCQIWKKNTWKGKVEKGPTSWKQKWYIYILVLMLLPIFFSEMWVVCCKGFTWHGSKHKKKNLTNGIQTWRHGRCLSFCSGSICSFSGGARPSVSPR